MLFAMTVLAALLTPQAPEPPAAKPPVDAPSFDAVSIRSAVLVPGNAGVKTNPGRLSAHAVRLANLIEEAYGISSLEIANVPDLGFFDIEATAEGMHTRAELMRMLQNLLAQRFKLTFHREMREMQVAALAVDKGGWKGEAPASADGDPSVAAHGDRGNSSVRHIFFDGQNVTLPYLARYLGPSVRQILIDQTGLQGAFDFHVAVPVDADRAADRNIPESVVREEIFTDLIGKLGLKLEKRRATVEILMVDHAQQPSEN